jgi:hypothetical protein
MIFKRLSRRCPEPAVPKRRYGVDAAGSVLCLASEVERSRQIEAAAESLDVVGCQSGWDEEVSPRFLMIHECARHNGHADFLREAIHGTVGI